MPDQAMKLHSIPVLLAAALILGACGGGGGGSGSGGSVAINVSKMPAAAPTTQLDAVRLSNQASFGPGEAQVSDIRAKGAALWVAGQMGIATSLYTHGGDGSIDQNTSQTSFCSLPTAPLNCWRDWYSTDPLVWDFYRNAVSQPDQLRQRMAFALAQIVVISGNTVSGTYGWRNYHNNLLSLAFGNYRDVLRKTVLSPLMGEYLNHVNNDPASPNENFGRELLQLFSIGTCQLNPDGTLQGGSCMPTYDNNVVREYAYALTGWTYPSGGVNSYGKCWPQGDNCRYLGGDMVEAAKTRWDQQARTLLSNDTVPATRTPTAALELVLDSLMKHPNTAPFVSRQLIQHLVSSNPSPAYVARVASAFAGGSFSTGGVTFGAGKAGDLTATVAAILLDPEARTETPAASAGKLREPVLLFTGALRALNGSSDGAALGSWWGETLQQHVFNPPTVFSFYPPDYPVAGANLFGPAFAITNTNTSLGRMNFLTYLIDWKGSAPDPNIPDAIGTSLNLSAFSADAADAGKLVDRMSLLMLGKNLSPTSRSKVMAAVDARSATNADLRTRTAAWLVLSSPAFQVMP